jgi:beta-N-acetylhexosaminidase
MIQLPLGPVILDVHGLTLTDVEIERLKHPLVGGVILFARNFKNSAQVKLLCDAIHSVRTPQLLICVDHEGGRVQRFREGFTLIPAMRRLGDLWMQDALAATRAASAIGFVMAGELRQVGVDFTFAPVLDLDFGGSSVIGDRAFHRDARVVTMLAKSVNHGMALAGMQNCGKHFPGHGFVKADSHIDVPIDDRELQEILDDDAAPYDWLGSPSLAAVMPAHVIYPQVDPNPAGFSKFWLQNILRRKFKFDGVIFSDDLSMEGAKVAGSVEDGAKAALAAGCDAVLICNSPDLAQRLLDSDIKVNATSSRRILSLVPRGDAPSSVALDLARKEITRAFG